MATRRALEHRRRAPKEEEQTDIAMCFPTVANAVVGSVSVADAGVAAGTNSAIRELGGVFGIAILAAVFAAQGSYASAASFIEGFKPAIAVAAAVPVLGAVFAALAPSRAQERQHRFD